MALLFTCLDAPHGIHGVLEVAQHLFGLLLRAQVYLPSGFGCQLCLKRLFDRRVLEHGRY